MYMKDINEEVNWLVKNWEKIPDGFKTNLSERYSGSSQGYIPGVAMEEHVVVLLLDRQKPSVEADYSFDEERIGITRTGKVIWGFDSGCSCPSPWHDSYPQCYSCSEGWKTFEVELKSFDSGVIEACLERIEQIRKAVE